MDLATSSGLIGGGRLSWVAVRRRWPLVLVVMVAFAGLAAFAGHRSTVSYQSSADLLVNPVEGLPYSPGSRGERLENLLTEVQLVTSDEVARAARENLGVTTPVAKLEKQVTAVNPPNSQIVAITFTADTPAAAREGAAAFAKAYLDYRTARAKTTIDSRVDRLREAVKSSEDDLSAANKDLKAAEAGSPAAIIAQQRARSAQQALAQLSAKINNLLATDTRPGSYLSPPTDPEAARPLPLAVLVTVGALVGLLLGLALAAQRALVDRRIHTIEDLEQHGLFVLGAVRRAPDNDGRAATRLLVDSHVGLADDIRVLRTVLSARAGAPSALVVAPVRGVPGESGGTLAALAAAFARSRTDVVLLDAGHGHFGPAADPRRGPTMVDVLRGSADLDDSVRETQPHLRLVAWGGGDADGDLASSQGMRNAISRLSDGAWVLVAAPALDRPEALGLFNAVGRAVLVVELGRTTTDELDRAVADAERCSVEIMGVVAERPGRSGDVPAAASERRPEPARSAQQGAQPGTEVRLLGSLGGARQQGSPTVTPARDDRGGSPADDRPGAVRPGEPPRSAVHNS